MVRTYSKCIFSFLVLVFLSSCAKINGTSQRMADATFYGGSEPIAFKIRLAQAEIEKGLSLYDKGEDPLASCQAEFDHGGCSDHLDRDDCGDLIALQSKESLMTAASILLADSEVRNDIRQAMKDSKFEVVSTLQAEGRHTIAIAPIGTTAQPVRYLGSALKDRLSVVPTVFHEMGHVTGFRDESILNLNLMHDVLSAAGLCVLKAVRLHDELATPAPEVTPPASSTPPSSSTPVTTALKPSRNYTGLYEMEIQGRKHIFMLEQLADGSIRGELSGIPGVVTSAVIAGQIKGKSDSANSDDISFTWKHGSNFPTIFAGVVSGNTGSGSLGSVTQAQLMTWQMRPSPANFSETFTGTSVLSARSKWAAVAGDFAINNELTKDRSAAFAMSVIRDVVQQDGKISAYMTWGTQVGDFAGLNARMDANGNGFWAGIYIENDGRIRAEIWKKDGNTANGDWFKTTNSSQLTQTSGLLELEVRGNQIRLYLDGVLVTSKSENKLLNAGQFGVRANYLPGLNTLRVTP